MISSENMGEVTQLAFTAIEEDLLIMNDELDPMDVLDYLEDGDYFKRTADLLKETMISAKIPSKTKQLIEEYNTVNSFLKAINDKVINAPILTTEDASNTFTNALLSLLTKQENECIYQKRKYPWNRSTISRWFSTEQNGASISIRAREDAIAICFALGLDYPTSRDFLNKSGHAILNIRNHEDAVYIYCLINNRPLSIARELINKFNIELAKQDNTNEEPISHHGYTTVLLTRKLLGNSNWETDDDFYNSFLLPNKSKFTSYSRTALNEYYRIKNPIYLLALKTIVAEEKYDNETGLGFNSRKIQEHIHENVKDREITIPMSSVQITYNFINNLCKYAYSSDLLKRANDMLYIHAERMGDKKRGDEDYKEDDFKTINNSLEVIDFIINNLSEYSNNEKEQETLSCFLTDTVTAYRMLCTWLPSVVVDDEDGNEYIQEYVDNDGNVKKRVLRKDKRQRSYRQSTLGNTVLSSFPHRNFFTQYEKHPEELVHDISLRKAIILLFYINYARNLLQEISNPNTTEEETEFGFDDFYKTMNYILGKCQLGKLYFANPFDWLILESVEKLETFSDEDDSVNPVSFLDKVLSFSFDSEDSNND